MQNRNSIKICELILFLTNEIYKEKKKQIIYKDIKLITRHLLNAQHISSLYIF